MMRLLHFSKYWIYIILIIIIQLIEINNYSYHLYYYNFYKPLSMYLGILTGLVSFSIGDILYLFFIFYVFYVLTTSVFYFTKARVKKVYLYYCFKKICHFSILFYCIFKLSWGVNYKNRIFENIIGNTSETYNESILNSGRIYIVKQLNLLRSQIPDSHILNLNFNKSIALAKHELQNTSIQNGACKIKKPILKLSSFPEVVNLFGFSGYFNPFTHEAQVRYNNPTLLAPLISVHELCHQLGFSSELETSCIALYISLHSQNKIIQYAALIDLYFYCIEETIYLNSKIIHNFKNKTKPSWLEIDKLIIDEKVTNDLKKTLAELKQQHTPLGNVIGNYIRKIYGFFLLLNNESNGLRSYNLMVGWFIKNYKQHF
ncbi:MAG: DUF3810 family protein [Alphaproteobacteria bacterium]|nr:DUF3810 family protein [Alphaproteobacteria bacterium]